MLSDTAVKEIVEANLEKIATALSLRNYWKIRVDYERREDGAAMACEVNLEYRRVHIIVDPSRHYGEQEVLNNLRHELLHVTFWPFHLYREHFIDVKDDKESEEARKEQQLWTFAVENLVANWEEILKHLQPDEYRFLKSLKVPKPKSKKAPTVEGVVA